MGQLPVETSVARPSRPGQISWLALGLASAYAVALIVAAFVAPVYQSDSASSSGASRPGTDTLVGVNGLSVAIVMSVPLLVTLAVGSVLLLAPERRTLPLAWTLTGLLAAGNLLAMLTVGVFVLPVTAALIVACIAYQRRSHPQVAAALPPAAV